MQMMMMRTAAKFVTTLLFLACCVSCHHFSSSSTTPASAPMTEWPADLLVRDRFDVQKSAFERLAAMVAADSRIWRVNRETAEVDQGFGKAPTAATEQDLPASRLRSYRRLMEQAGLRWGFTREHLKDGGNQVLFAVWAGPAGGGDTVEKGLLYSEAGALAGTAVEGELSREEAEKQKPALLYRKLSGNWYLYARYDE